MQRAKSRLNPERSRKIQLAEMFKRHKEESKKFEQNILKDYYAK